MNKKIVYVDMDRVLCDFDSAYHITKREFPCIDYPQSIVGFFSGLLSMKGAVEAFKWLASQPEFDVYILTAPSIKNLHCYTEKAKWVRKHLGEEYLHKLIISPNKGQQNNTHNTHHPQCGQPFTDSTVVISSPTT